MPWFCTSKPKKQKSKKKATPTKVGGGPHHRDNMSGFVVVRQSTAPQAPDELFTTRGQVVELLYTNKEWNYVKNVDGQCGYVPRDFCLPLDGLEQIQSVRTAGTTIPRPTKPRTRPRPLGLQSPQVASTSMTVRSSAVTMLQVEEAGGDSFSTGIHVMQHASEGNGGGSGQRCVSNERENGTMTSRTRDSQRENGTMTSRTRDSQRENGTMTSRTRDNGGNNGSSCGRVVDSGTLDSTITTNSTSTNTSTTCTQCCSTLFGFKGTRVVPVQDHGEGLPSSSTSNAGATNPTRVPEAMKPHEYATAPVAPGYRTTPTTDRALHRATSYQEAVITADQKLYGLTAGIRPAYLPIRPLHLQEEEDEDDHPTHREGGPAHYLRGTLEHNYETLESIKSATTPITVNLLSPRGGVFRYEERKPQGIFIAESDYRPRLQGEVPLHRGEMVVVMDYGQGEWAWVLTASNQEGAVPKSILSRYLGDPMMTAPRNGDDGWESPKVSTGTQTELVVSSAVVRDSSSSNGSLVRGVASPASLTSKSHHNSMSMRYSVATPTSSVFPRRHSTAACVLTNTSGGGREWFRSSDRLCEEEPVPSPQADHRTPLQSGHRTPPQSGHCTPPQSSYHTPPQSRYRTPPSQSGYLLPQPTTPSSLCSVGAGTLERHHQGRLAANGVDFEPEYDTISTISEQRRVRQTPVLIALRDCTPPASSKHTLVLKKGDILHHHPQENYPNGWMWVYHTLHKRYGYVPKSHVAYMYVVQKKPRKDESSKEESV